VTRHMETGEAAKRVTPSRDRTRAYRARRARNTSCLTIRMTEGEYDRLEAAGYLDAKRRGDRDARREAVEDFIADYLP
jgi:hypothetical protein